MQSWFHYTGVKKEEERREWNEGGVKLGAQILQGIGIISCQPGARKQQVMGWWGGMNNLNRPQSPNSVTLLT